MTSLKVHKIESAPDKSKASLEQTVTAFRLLAGLHSVLTSSPEILETNKTLHSLFQNWSFNPGEQPLAWQTLAV